MSFSLAEAPLLLESLGFLTILMSSEKTMPLRLDLKETGESERMMDLDTTED